MRKKKNNVSHITIISIIIVLLVLGLSIGWSSFNASMQISSQTLVRINADIRITDFMSSTSTNGGNSLSSDYNVDYVMGSLNLPNSNSTVTYKVEVTNMQLPTNTFMGINTLDGLPNNLEIKSITDYTLKDKICDDNDSTYCSSGSQKTFYITIGYKNNMYDANNTSYGFVINFDFEKVFNITYSGFNNPPASPKTAIKGATPVINFDSEAQTEVNVTMGGVTLVKGTNYTYVNHILTFLTPITDHVTITNPSAYTITYVLNGGTQVNGQITAYMVGVVENILPLESSIDAVFNGWYQNSDFIGDPVTDTSNLSGNVTLYAKWTYKVAKRGNNYYDTLKQAINSAPNNTNTLIELIHDTKENNITIAANKNITLDLHNSILSNTDNNPILVNNGTLTLINGEIQSNATQGAINNNATFNMTGGRIVITGTRQAIYNAGTVTISGDAYLSNVSNERAPVQNLSTGTMTITGGTIVASNFSAFANEGTLTIGAKDGSVSTTSPLLRGIYGVSSTVGYNFYDGKIGGTTSAFEDESKITDIETGYELAHKAETISGINYRVSYLAKSLYTVTFNPGDGTIDPQDATREIEAGGTVGALPTATRYRYVLEGWYDDDNDHHKISASEVINGNKTFYAHWEEIVVPKVARVGLVEYETFDEAWAAISNTAVTLTLLDNITVSQKYTITNSQNVTIDLNGKSLGTETGTLLEVFGSLTVTDSGSGGELIGGKIINNTHNPCLVNKSGGHVTISSGTIRSNLAQVVDNSGTMTITGGTITMGNVTNGVLNNNVGATLTMTGGTISAPIAGQKRQAIYNKGTVNISGTAHLMSASSDRATVQNDADNAKITISGGTIESANTSCQRGAVQNVAKAYVTITGGTITSKSTNNNAGAVQNAGYLVIGEKDGIISMSTPELQGEKHGVNSTGGTFKFYDGIIKGYADSINGTVTEIETDATRVDTTVQISGKTYHVSYLNKD